jgi:hypothetical protein
MSLSYVKRDLWATCWWLTPVIPATQEAQIRRIVFQSQPGQIVHETLSWKLHHKNTAGGVAQGVGPEFKPQYCKKKKRDLWYNVNLEKQANPDGTSP